MKKNYLGFLKVLFALVIVICGISISNSTVKAGTITSSTMYGVWEGSYAGIQNGKTVERKIRFDVSASSELGIVSGVANIDGGKNGTYSFTGTVDFETGEVNLEGEDWLANPANFGFAKYCGALDKDGTTIKGNLGGYADKKFKLTKTSAKPVSYKVKKKDLLKTFYGEYDGAQEGVVVRRNMELTISSIDDDGKIYGEIYFTPSTKSPAKYGVYGRYKFKGEVDFNTGKLSNVQGYQWILKPTDNFSFAEFKGYYNVKKNAVIGTSHFNSSYQGIWSLPQSFAKNQTISVKKAFKKTVVISKKDLKKKNKTLQLGAKAKTKLTYKVTKGSKKYINVSNKGKITIKKGAKSGIYKVTVYAKRTGKFKDARREITIKVK